MIFSARLFQWQIIDGREYKEQAINQSVQAIQIEAARGEILDANGNVLAGNKMFYCVTLHKLDYSTDSLNSSIIRLINLLESQGEEWTDILPIKLDVDGNYFFDEENQSEIDYLKSSQMLNMQEYATADDCMQALIEEFNAEGYSKENARNLVSVRYAMRKANFRSTLPYTVAEDISAETVGLINESSDELYGVRTAVTSKRYYPDGTIAPHIIGTVGAISAEQYEAASENDNLFSQSNLKGYSLNDTMGREGIENAFEDELRGARGLETLVIDNTGEVQSSQVTNNPIQGNTVYLTIDSKLQRVANDSLAENINANPSTDCTAGAAVVLSVKDFSVLACSSYPSYDLSRYAEDDDYIQSLQDDPLKPLFSNALSGEFTPGSVFKPLVAMAALDENIITTESSVFCDGSYDYYEEYPINCIDGQPAGYRDIYSALQYSCNTYFADVGRRTGIDILDAYADYFALGSKTGIELYESTGLMSNREEYRYNHGIDFTDGITAMAAIGQADSRFTPLQLATYCATIANGGVRLRTHLLKKVTDYKRDLTVSEYNSEVMADSGVSQNTLNIVQTGMEYVASYGTASTVFSSYPVKIAAKTGTAENSNGKSDNLLFIAYAPADDPEIAVAVVMQYGAKGDYCKYVAKDIFNCYFGYDSDGNPIEDENSDSSAGENGD